MNIPFRLPFDASRHCGFTTPLRLLLATTAAFWMGTAQSHVVTTAVPQQVTGLRFRDFFRTAAGQTGLEISDILRQSDGQPVRLVGYMVQQENPVPGRFLLVPRPAPLSQDGADHAAALHPSTVVVYLDPSQQDWTVPHVAGLVTVRGKLSVSRDDRAPRVHLQLDPETTAGVNGFELTGYLHKLQR